MHLQLLLTAASPVLCTLLCLLNISFPYFQNDKRICYYILLYANFEMAKVLINESMKKVFCIFSHYLQLLCPFYARYYARSTCLCRELKPTAVARSCKWSRKSMRLEFCPFNLGFMPWKTQTTTIRP